MATFNINNRSDIQKMVKAINKEMRISIEMSLMQIGEIVKEVWKDFVNAFWYGIYDPIVYKRTYETLNSIVTSNVTKIGDIYMVSIFYDTSLINSFQYGGYTGHENPDLMPYLIEEGDGSTVGHPRASHAYERTIDWLNDKSDFENAVVGALKVKGFDIKLK